MLAFSKALYLTAANQAICILLQAFSKEDTKEMQLPSTKSKEDRNKQCGDTRRFRSPVLGGCNPAIFCLLQAFSKEGTENIPTHLAARYQK